MPRGATIKCREVFIKLSTAAATITVIKMTSEATKTANKTKQSIDDIDKYTNTTSKNRDVTTATTNYVIFDINLADSTNSNMHNATTRLNSAVSDALLLSDGWSTTTSLKFTPYLLIGSLCLLMILISMGCIIYIRKSRQVNLSNGYYNK